MSERDFKSALAEVLQKVLSKTKVSEEDSKDGKTLTEYMKQIIKDFELRADIEETERECRIRLAFDTGGADLGRSTGWKIAFITEYVKRRTAIFIVVEPSIPMSNIAHQVVRDAIVGLNNKLFTGAFILLEDDEEGVLTLGYRDGFSYVKCDPPNLDFVKTFFSMAVETMRECLKEFWEEIEKGIPEEKLQLKEVVKDKDYGLKDMEPINGVKH